MPVSLYTGETYVVNRNNIDVEWCISFFEKGCTDACLILYENNHYRGIITHKSLIQGADLDRSIVVERFYIEDDLWNNIRSFFDGNKKMETVPVLNQDMKFVCAVKYDDQIEQAWDKVCELENYVDKEIWNYLLGNVQYVHITGINDVLFKLREWLLSFGVKVSVEGDGWKFFGIETAICKEESTIVVDESCKWIDSVYIEYWNWLNDYAKKLKKIIFKPYIPETGKEKRVMFYLSYYPCFVESVNPLIFRYTQSKTECICVFPDIEGIEREGRKNIDDMIGVVEKLEGEGVKYHVASEQGLYSNKYDICFILSEYSGRLPTEFRNLSQKVIALQTTPLYTHMYQVKGKFEEVFSAQARKEYDYLIASDYIANWICERDKSWDKKILRFGYPKLDALYAALNEYSDIPENWIDRISGKNVYLFTTYNMKPSWLNLFADKNGDKIAIWRPHPNYLGKTETKKKAEEIVEKYNVIIDDNLSYYLSFKLSDALIASAHSSIAINYLYTRKPICLYDANRLLHETAVIDYQNELWYKSMYIASKEQDVLEFIRSIEDGIPIISEQQEEYRRYVVGNFDGLVCERIYEYLQNQNFLYKI